MARYQKLVELLRKSLSDDDSLPTVADTASQLPLQTYHEVIQQLKQQKHELTTLRDAGADAVGLRGLDGGLLVAVLWMLADRWGPALDRVVDFIPEGGLVFRVVDCCGRRDTVVGLDWDIE